MKPTRHDGFVAGGCRLGTDHNAGPISKGCMQDDYLAGAGLGSSSRARRGSAWSPIVG